MPALAISAQCVVNRRSAALPFAVTTRSALPGPAFTTRRRTATKESANYATMLTTSMTAPEQQLTGQSSAVAPSGAWQLGGRRRR